MRKINYIISRDSDFVDTVNLAEKKKLASTPGAFLKETVKWD